MGQYTIHTLSTVAVGTIAALIFRYFLSSDRRKQENSSSQNKPSPGGSKNTTTITQKSSHFLRIPLEIRKDVYETLFSNARSLSLPEGYLNLYNPSGGSLPSESTSHLPEPEKHPPVLKLGGKVSAVSLLRVSKQIYEEATPTFYSTNCFCVQVNVAEFTELSLPQIGERNASFITKIFFPFPAIKFETFEGLVYPPTTNGYLTPTHIQGLESLCKHFSGLKEIDFGHGMRKSLDMIEKNLGYDEAAEVIEKIQSYFMRISSLKRVSIALKENFYLEGSK